MTTRDGANLMDWTDIDNKLTDPQWYTTRDYHETYALLRREDPVHWSVDDRYGRSYWYITRHSLVRDALSSPKDFSSRMPTGRIPRSPRRLTPEQQFAMGHDISLTANDDPIHALYRRPMNKHFSAPAIGRLARDVESYVDELIDEVATKDDFDLIADVCAELPVRVMLRMLGVPVEDWDDLKTAAHMWGTPYDPRFMIDGDAEKTALTGLTRISDYGVALAKQRRTDPRDDFATVVANLEVDGDPLSDHEMRMWFWSLIAGGLETTRAAAGVGMWAFFENPDQRDFLLANPGLANSAVEEVIRWVTPAKHVMRVVTEDMDFGEKRLRSGDWVFLALASANKDEHAFADPHRFDITRTPNDHLGLGDGVHKCLGRSLVRLELRILFTKVLRAFPDLGPVEAGEPAWVPDNASTEISTMRVTHHGNVQVSPAPAPTPA